ncbi:MAG: DUF2244 domain-containing protein [Pseudomonadota bacterium]|jgi:uncharacterized membrane protein|uniref:DUF2244 domain-containing protein n=1 Tax=uncultured gamma proteobacterium HF0010_11B23 TaxID=710979 RepID=E0XQT5_9GAMM|nr:hypothetical protein [uncultured gamma proteobacterium HF0010_11B23]MEC7271669.1 DUF2244 domain-containing protein [Pseudomonadota bacterium]|tara:strand:+ start:680 stop:1141 length:462 start_codon:yes stop_codon:yes gene_type:complete
MIKKKITKNTLSLTLTPNKSSTVQQNLIFFGFLSVICMTFAIGFFVLGATMILPFAGLEILILFLVLKANRNWLNQSEKIELDKLYVKLKKGKNDLIFDRFLSKFSIVDHKTKKRIFITSDKKKVEIGSFLNEEEIEELITLLKKKVQDLNFS